MDKVIHTKLVGNIPLIQNIIRRDVVFYKHFIIGHRCVAMSSEHDCINYNDYND
jgi:hypothetical protein